ncbi:unnamed protein product [Vitrella brassicaformis CCMP3155]|uniref:F-box domain-containing protein n=1 Tax=Vitrella brassicaformis (strain CCMP3155) TaxID=1169540 RepID=A0A0G4EQP2_VITBC|nr:unnamed protein product [Vitrella brassicaformis CCMP3155]|eukprot:CEL99755.1 unnamed protein product [Vitrella brassicaformis CCMP3155]
MEEEDQHQHQPQQQPFHHHLLDTLPHALVHSICFFLDIASLGRLRQASSRVQPVLDEYANFWRIYCHSYRRLSALALGGATTDCPGWRSVAEASFRRLLRASVVGQRCYAAASAERLTSAHKPRCPPLERDALSLPAAHIVCLSGLDVRHDVSFPDREPLTAPPHSFLFHCPQPRPFNPAPNPFPPGFNPLPLHLQDNASNGSGSESSSSDELETQLRRSAVPQPAAVCDEIRKAEKEGRGAGAGEGLRQLCVGDTPFRQSIGMFNHKIDGCRTLLVDPSPATMIAISASVGVDGHVVAVFTNDYPVRRTRQPLTMGSAQRAAGREMEQDAMAATCPHFECTEEVLTWVAAWLGNVSLLFGIRDLCHKTRFNHPMLHGFTAIVFDVPERLLSTSPLPDPIRRSRLLARVFMTLQSCHATIAKHISEVHVWCVLRDERVAIPHIPTLTRLKPGFDAAWRLQGFPEIQEHRSVDGEAYRGMMVVYAFNRLYVEVEEVD